MCKDNLKIVKNDLCKKIVDSKYHKLIMGFTASALHIFIISSILIVAIFSFDLKALIVTLIIGSGIMTLNLILHNCPLTHMEQSMLGDSVIDIMNRYFPINYSKDRCYEVQLQYIFISLAIIVSKIMFFFIRNDMKNYFNIKYTTL